MQSPTPHPERHCIQRQVIELTIGASAGGPALQERFARAFWEHAVPELEALFDRIACGHGTVRLERVEIDLGEITEADWELQFRRRLVAALERRLVEHRVDSASG